MNRRRKNEYNLVLQSIIKEAKSCKIVLKLKTVMMDFEKAAMNSFIVIKLCLFHFSQSIFRNIVNCGIKTIYTKDEKIKLWFKRIFA